MSAGRRPEGRERAGPGRPRRSGGQPGSAGRAARLPSGPCTAACARHRGLEAITAATASQRLGPAPPGPASCAGPAPGHPPLCCPAARQPSLSVHTQHTYIYGAGDRLTSATPSGSRLKLTPPGHERGPLVHGHAPLPLPSPPAPTRILPAPRRLGKAPLQRVHPRSCGDPSLNRGVAVPSASPSANCDGFPRLSPHPHPRGLRTRSHVAECCGGIRWEAHGIS